MANYAVLKLDGEDTFWLVDFSAGTVSTMDKIATDPFGFTSQADASGAAIIKGVDVAVAVGTRDDAFAGKLDA